MIVDLPNYGVPSKRFDGRCNNVVTSLNIEVVYASIGIIIIIIEICRNFLENCQKLSKIVEILSKKFRKFKLHSYVCFYCVIFILLLSKFSRKLSKIVENCRKFVENYRKFKFHNYVCFYCVTFILVLSSVCRKW